MGRDDQHDQEYEKPLLSSPVVQVEGPSSAQHHWAEPAPDNESNKSKAKSSSANARLMSLDVFRGLTIAVMILVDDAGETFKNVMNHSPWDNITLADFVMPAFLFIVGLSMSLSFKKSQSPRSGMDRSAVFKKAVIRSAKLFAIGLIVQGGNEFLDYDLATLRWCGILQRIAFAYLIATIVELYVPRVATRRSTAEDPLNLLEILRRDSMQWGVLLLTLSVYIGIMFATPLPAPCHSGQFTEECNAAYYWDSKILGMNHLYPQPEYVRSAACSSCSPGYCPRDDAPEWCSRPFDPEGMVSSFSAIGSCLIGLFFGHILNDHRKNWKALCSQWVMLGAFLVAVGLGLHFSQVIPMNKQLYSVSYMLFMAGFCGILMSITYILIDVQQDSVFRNLFVLPLKWLGTNAMLVFVFGASNVLETMIGWVYYEKRSNNLVHWWNHDVLINKLGFDWGTLIATLIKITFWMIVCGVLDRKKLYWKV